jgi:hypothetical protein
MIGTRDENRLNRASAAVKAWQDALENIREMRSNRAA